MPTAPSLPDGRDLGSPTLLAVLSSSDPVSYAERLPLSPYALTTVTPKVGNMHARDP